MHALISWRTVAAGAALFVALSAQAAPITGLFGTGLDGTGSPVPGAGTDANYTVLETGAQALVRTGLPGTYFANSATSQWIWQQANGLPVNVTRTFRTTFDLTGFDASTAVINGLWGVDNIGLDILINGVSTGNALPGAVISNFSSLHAFSISSGFVSGLNTLDFRVQDVGGVSAFRAELSGTARAVQGVPEPATSALVALALLAAVSAARRGQRS